MSSYLVDDDYGDYAEDAAREEFIKDTLKSISQEAAKTYLGTYGDAIDARVQFFLSEAESLLKTNHPGASLCLSTAAIELIIRFMILRPLIQGAFLSDDWAEILADRIATGRTVEDRILLPAVLKVLGIDLSTLKTSSGELAWDTLTKSILLGRNNFIHRGDPVTPELAQKGLECALCFRRQIVGVNPILS